MPGLRTAKRSLLVVMGVALGAGLLAAVLILSATMQEAVLQQRQSVSGDWDIMVARPGYDALSVEAVNFISTVSGVDYVVPQATVMSGSIQTPVQYYVSLGRFPDSAATGVLTMTGALQPGEVLLPVGLAEQLKVSPGDTVSLPFVGRERSVEVAGLLPEAYGTMPSAYFPYEWLADALQLDGPLALLLGLAPGARKADVIAAIQFEYPHLVFGQQASIEELRWKLEGLNVVARVVGVSGLLAGAVLTLTAFGISVHERTRELALLRAIGAEPRQVKQMLTKEALGLGAVGATVGTGLGLAASAALARHVAQYLELPGASLIIPWPVLALIFAGTIILTLVGAWPAASHAARIPPLAAMRPPTSTMEHVSQRSTRRWTAALIAIAAAAAGADWSIPPDGANAPLTFLLGFLGATVLLLAVIVSLPVTIPSIGRGTALVSSRFIGILTHLGMRNVERQKVRSGRTAGILVVGTALLVAIVSLMATERVNTEHHMRKQLPTEGWVKGPWAPPTGYGDDMVAAMAAIPGVTNVVPVGREVEADLLDFDVNRVDAEYRRLVEAGGDPVERLAIQAVDFAALSTVADYGRVEGDLYGGIVLTRRVAKRFGIALGDTLRIKPANGSPVETISVTALVDNLPQISDLAADRVHFQSLYVEGEQYGSSLLDFDLSADRQLIADEVRALLIDGFAAFSYTDADEWKVHWRQQVFEQMVMVGGMGVLLLLIAAAGLINTMAANLRERQDELTTLYAIGATPVQLVRLVRAEALTIGSAGSVLGVVTAVLMMYALMGRGIPMGEALQFPWVAIVSGLFAGPVMAAAAAIILVRTVLRPTVL